jgi:hypothetical protein
MATTRRRVSFTTKVPAIATPRTLDLASIQGAIDNIRERFKNADAEIALLRQYADAGTAQQRIDLLTIQFGKLSPQLAALQAALDSIQNEITRVSITRKAPEPTRVRGPGLVLVTQEAGGVAVDLDQAGMIGLIRAVAPRAPAPQRPDDAEFILAARIFGG